jgi:GrpB-like predicted nucleotidyltransferase (UPF0157 family)
VDSAWGSSRPAISEDALDLNEDIGRLDEILRLMSKVSPRHIYAVDTKAHRHSGEVQHRTTMAVVKGWQRWARQRLMRDYLAPHRDNGR